MAQTWRIMGGLGNDNISHIPFNEEARNESIYEDFLQKSAKQSRIIAICASNIIVRDIMMKAKQLGMLDSGDYVFINVDLFSSNLQRPWFASDATEEENEIARNAFQHVLTISSSKSVNGNFNQFKQKVETVASKTFNNSSGENFVNSFVGNYYDAIKIFSSALSEVTSRTDRSRVDGKMITDNIWNKTHDGVFGSLNIDKNGDRKIEFSLLDLKHDKEDFEVVQVYHGTNNSFQVVKRI